MFPDISKMKVFLCLGPTDMRKSINTLSLLVQEDLKLDLMTQSIFIFCNKRRAIMKALYWDANGFCLWQKRRETDKFKWPKGEKDTCTITTDELNWLLKGFDFKNAHKKLNYSGI